MPNQRFKKRVKDNIDKTFLEFLKNQRNIGDLIKKKNKKTLKIQSGYSVTFEEMNKENIYRRNAR